MSVVLAPTPSGLLGRPVGEVTETTIEHLNFGNRHVSSRQADSCDSEGRSLSAR